MGIGKMGVGEVGVGKMWSRQNGGIKVKTIKIIVLKDKSQWK
jgi:hypothetical protein